MISRAFRVNIPVMGNRKSKLGIMVTIAFIGVFTFLGSQIHAQQRRPGGTPPPPQSPSRDRADRLRDLSTSWEELKEEARNWLPNQIEDAQAWLESLRVVERPDTVIESYDETPRLWKSINNFYNFIKGKELDIYQEQRGIPRFFPNRSKYYDFLDTILPAMRERRFERHRLLSYEIHSIEHCLKDPEDPESGKDRKKVKVTMTITSDDTYPFGKVMTYTQFFHLAEEGWYPGKIEAPPATLWEKIR